MSSNTRIKLKRTQESLSSARFQDHSINFGEPIFIDNNVSYGDKTQKCDSYIAVGSPIENGQVKNAALFKGFWDINKANSLVFYKPGRDGIVDEENNDVYVDKVITKNIYGSADSSQKYYLMCQPNISDVNSNDYRSVKTFQMGDAGIYISSRGVLYGAAWNDYAEKREVVSPTSDIEPGTVVCESGDGTLRMSYERLQPCAYVVSDTYGFVIGKEDHTPVAVSGRVLVKVNDENIKVGDCVCAGSGGKAFVMTREEIINYPDRILGIITEIPEYDEWNDVKVKHRVWIKVK